MVSNLVYASFVLELPRMTKAYIFGMENYIIAFSKNFKPSPNLE